MLEQLDLNLVSGEDHLGFSLSWLLTINEQDNNGPLKSTTVHVKYMAVWPARMAVFEPDVAGLPRWR